MYYKANTIRDQLILFFVKSTTTTEAELTNDKKERKKIQAKKIIKKPNGNILSFYSAHKFTLKIKDKQKLFAFANGVPNCIWYIRHNINEMLLLMNFKLHLILLRNRLLNL